MRAILGLIVIVLIAAILGWVSFGDSPNEATITVEKQKIRADVDKATEAGKEMGRKLRSDTPDATPVVD